MAGYTELIVEQKAQIFDDLCAMARAEREVSEEAKLFLTRFRNIAMIWNLNKYNEKPITLEGVKEVLDHCIKEGTYDTLPLAFGGH